MVITTIKNKEVNKIRIGIIGSNGFIGRYVKSILQKDSSKIIILWDRNYHGDFLTSESRESFLNLHKFDLIYQLAWVNIEDDKYRSNPSNLLFAHATVDFISSCLERGIRMVVMGTHQNPEDDSLDLYLTSKKILKSFVEQIQSDLVHYMSPTFVFSIKDRRPHLFRSFIDSVGKGYLGTQLNLNTPDMEIDLIHVRDVAECLVEISSESIKAGSYIIASGLTTRVDVALAYLRVYLKLTNTAILPTCLLTSFNTSEKHLLFNRFTQLFYKQDDSVVL